MRRLLAIIIAIIIVVLVRFYFQEDSAPQEPSLSNQARFKTVIQPEGYRPTPSPLSPAILVGDTLYISGNTGGDPETGELVEGGLDGEMHQVFANLQTVLAAANMSLDDVVSVTSYLTTMK